MKQTYSISEFFATDYVDFASYSTIRMLASAIDGQKNAARKVLKTVLDKNIRSEMKVSQLASKVAEYTEYLHGDVSLQGVIVTMAQNFPGTNNIPLLDREGNFGNRFINEASAPRYIYTNGSKFLFDVITKEDDNILTRQYFEGAEIEPRFYLPTLPLLLINGSEGIASGFAQKILPRNEKEIVRYIKNRLNGKAKKPFDGKPFFNGFNGDIEAGDDNGWLIKGKFVKLTNSKVKITEIPIGYNLKGYLKVLDTLEEKGIINSYVDKSNDDIFEFIVTFPRGVLTKLDDDKILDTLKLIRRVTENYTAIDEDNKVRVFENIGEIMDYYIDVKLRYMQKRKDYLIETYVNDIKYLISRYVFVKMIVDKKLEIGNVPKADIEEKLDTIDKIIKKEGSYDYLLNMRISSLTAEKLKELQDMIYSKKSDLDEIRQSSLQDMWLTDLKGI
jgi:DNA topoisomerase-2